MIAPSPLGALFLFVLIVGARIALGPIRALCFVVAYGCLVVSSRQRRRPVLRAGLVTGVGVAFVALVAYGRWLGGEELGIVWEDGVAAVSVFGTVALGLAIIAGSFDATATLQLADTVGLPRSATYVLLATGTTIDLVRDYGRGLTRLLRLKGMIGGGAVNRVRSYYRLLTPLFTVMMNSELVHARSLQYRGFFELPQKTSADVLRVTWTDGIAVGSAVLVLVVLWVLR